MAIDPFYEHYYETGIDITGEIYNSQEEECGCEESRFEQTRVTPKQISPFFKEAVEMENIALPKSFWKVLK